MRAVGIDLHRRRSVIYRTNAAGEKLGRAHRQQTVRLAAEVAKAGRGAHVLVEAAYGWYWAVVA